MELQQSVQASLETIEALARDAKARVGDGIAGIRPALGAPAFPEQSFREPAFAEPDFRAPQPSPSKRYNVSFDDAYELPAEPALVSFDDDPAFMSAASATPSFVGSDVDADGIPVWEDPP